MTKDINLVNNPSFSDKAIIVDENSNLLKSENRLLINDNELNTTKNSTVSKSTYENIEIEKMFESDKSIAYNICLLAGEIAIIIYSTEIRDLIIVYLCRKEGIEVTETLSAFSIIFTIFSLTLPYAFTQGYSFKVANAYGEKDYKYIGKLSNKTNFFMLILSVFSILIIFTIILPIISSFLKNEQAVINLRSMLIWNSVGLPIIYLQFVQFRYLTAIGEGLILSIFVVISVFIELAFGYLFIKVFRMINFGRGMAPSFGFFANYIMNFIYIRKSESCPKIEVSFTEGMFENFWNYVWYSLILGGIIFISFITLDFLAFYGLVLGDLDYTMINIMITILYLFINDPFPIAVSIMINYLISIKKIEKLNRVMIIGLIITLSVLLVFTLFLYFGYSFLVKLFSDQELILNSLLHYREWTVVCLLALYLHAFIAETISAIGGENFAFITTIIGKVGVTNVVVLICIYGFQLGYESILIGLLAGQIFTLIMNFGYYIHLFMDDQKTLKQNIKEIEEFNDNDKNAD